ncbi:hypothetical protein Franean1_2636 [Parafrankia sp. EAN1pec]|uniref:hypothetical protein n=1 Tax=Parafrankia sp. (strain EAN1pec) TaxID=298653 RepID=UPI000054020D|nr:hypothetical protein Franean1_2636 [Frankia sp. EAN1pec]
MSRPSSCPVCWPHVDVAWLVEHAERRITATTAELWPQAKVTFGAMVTAGGALWRQVRVGDDVLCATVRPVDAALARVVRGEHGDLTTMLAGYDEGRANLAVRKADGLTALAAYSRLRVAAPIAMTSGVMFTPWVAGTSLAGRLQAQPAVLTELLTTLMQDLGELHRDPAKQLRRIAAPTRAQGLPRVVTEALGHATDHLHAEEATAGEVGELRALAGSLSIRLGRLAAQLDPPAFTRTGIAFGNLTPSHVLYPDASPRAVLVSPTLGPGGEPADTGTLLGHLHLLAVGCPPRVRAELVEGVEAWLAGRLADCRDQWKSWLSAVLTIWAATVYDTAVTALTLPAAALPLTPATAGLRARPLAALTLLDVLTRELRRRGADAALNATLATLADTAIDGADQAETVALR